MLDRDFELPLGDASVLAVELGVQVTTGPRGNYVFPELAPGNYTLVFSKPGYVRQLESVAIGAGQLRDVNVQLAAEFVEMDEFVAQDIGLGGGGELALLELRLDSPAQIDSISSDLMSRAGASDAASALRLVSGTTVSDGKFAVVRGLPDRYVSSQLNGVRMPSADDDTRAVELDQFPAAIIENIQVTKTFTPDQQGDASGGAVNVLLKGIPDERVMDFKAQYSVNSNVGYRDDFLSYGDGGVGYFGFDKDNRNRQLKNLGESWNGSVGVSEENAPIDGKFSMALGDSRELDNGIRIGGFGSFFYERDSSYFDDGEDNSYWVDNPGDGLSPQKNQQTASNEFFTALFDVTQGTVLEQYGGLGKVGLESDNHALGLTFFYTHTSEDTSVLAEDTKGKAYFVDEMYGVEYDPDDPSNPGNSPENRLLAPYIRTETLEYTERETGSVQLDGLHTLPFEGFEVGSLLSFNKPEFDWVVSYNWANSDQPDKRQFGSYWVPEIVDPGFPPLIPPSSSEPTWFPFKPAANFNLGNLQRTWQSIEEDDNQGSLNLKLPFEQWSEEDGYFKLGLFRDRVDRTFDQDSFSNFGDASASFLGGFDDFWSAAFPDEDHPITESLADVDYKGKSDIDAYYAMVDMPLSETVTLIGGARLEKTHMSITNDPEEDAVWFPPGATAPVALQPGDGDVDFDEDNVLPSIGLIYEPDEQWTLRTSYSKTIARQTFKELSPILQQEFLGGPVFIGNPDLELSKLDNFDVRIDFAPYPGSLLSISYFYKHIDKPIEFVQRLAGFNFTTPVNYPHGRISGIEAEVRQDLGRFWDATEGLSVGVNATWIDSSVRLPDEDSDGFDLPNIQAPTKRRDMVNTPDHLYNFFATYDLARTGTQFSVFYTVTGETLVRGAAQNNGNYVPDVYAKSFGVLNASIAQPIGPHSRLIFQAKNLTNPEIEEVYRSDYTDGDTTQSKFTSGREFSIALSLSF